MNLIESTLDLIRIIIDSQKLASLNQTLTI